MKTPKQFQKNLENHIITEEMLEQCLYSVNKRAKNCRDQIKKYRYSYYKHSQSVVEQYEKKKELYYYQKDVLLTLLKPECIHKVIRHNQMRRRICDDEEEYQNIRRCDVVYQNSYFDKRTGKKVNFKDVMIQNDKIEYFLFYKTAHHTFHKPIQDVSFYPSLKCCVIELMTEGMSVTYLISAQFVSKVVQLIESKEYTFITYKESA